MKFRRLTNIKKISFKSKEELQREEGFYTFLKAFFIGTTIFCVFLSLVISIFVYRAVKDLPDVSNLSTFTQESTKIYDMNDELIGYIHGDENRVTIPLRDMSPWITKAVIAIEDERFYTHQGIDLKGISRALMTNLSNGESSQGGSTITQQLVKNSFLINKKSLSRKLAEAILAIRTERTFAKDDILKMYLNRIYWGSLCYGVESASKRYFNKPASQLNLAEASLMAGLLKAPEGYSPYKQYKKAKKRQMLVLNRMMQLKQITKKQALEAYNTPLLLNHTKPKLGKYPYFVHYINSLISEKYGRDALKKSGLKVYTTLNPKVQKIAQNTLKEQIEKLSRDGLQGVIVSIDANTAQLQALVGGADYSKSNFNRATQAKRSPGSLFKPIVYLTGLRKEVIKPDGYILDAPIALNGGYRTWRPKNWDGRFLGKITVREALYKSRNTPSVRLALKVGVDEIISTARLCGIKSHINDNYTIALGSFGVSPLEMAQAYTTIANYGLYKEVSAIRRIENIDGKVIYENKPVEIQVIDKKYVKDLISIMEDVVKKGTGRSSRLENRTSAGKTGTSDDSRDLWFGGFTPDTVTIVWFGRDDNRPLSGMTSGNCARMWKAFSTEYYNQVHIVPKEFECKDENDICKKLHLSDKSY